MDYQPGRYIACTYDAQWYIGCIKDRSDEHGDILVSFMKRSAQNALSWPRQKDECWVPFQHVICRVNAPDVQSSDSRQYFLNSSDLDKVLSLLPGYVS